MQVVAYVVVSSANSTNALVSSDRRVVADAIASNERGRVFEFPQLIDRAAREGGASSIELINGRACQLVVVPVLAPTPTAWIAVGFVIDDDVVSELQQLTSLQVSFLERDDADHQWNVVAEGVEDEVDLRTLRIYGCDQAQGYLMSRPLAPREQEEWLKHSPWSPLTRAGVAPSLTSALSEALPDRPARRPRRARGRLY